ncbi:hypothetical protein [Haloechinothrix salitolerans]|uniref:DUF3800 domain-containing protein n=1 Tax=Haloechinothrix salitolerans TaxID=926830 RepID=A0ABW2BSI3_9PSEU
MTPRLHMIFLDDSMQSRRTRKELGRVAALGAVIVPPESLKVFGDYVKMLRVRYGVPTSSEIKWSPSPNDSWMRARENTPARVSLYEKILQGARICQIRSVYAALDLDAVTWWDEDEAKRRLLEFVYERVSLSLEASDDEDAGTRSVGVVVADTPSGDRKDEKKMVA